MAQALSVHANAKHNIHRDYASVIASYPGTVAPLNLTRLEKAHVYVLRDMYLKYTREKTQRCRCFPVS